MAIDWSVQFASLKEATEKLGGTHFTEHEVQRGGARTYPAVMQSATIHGTPNGDVRLEHVECYGWHPITS